MENKSDKNIELTYWEKFVLNHQKRGNLILHFISLAIFYSGIILAIINYDPIYLLMSVFCGIPGALGHIIYKEHWEGPQEMFNIGLVWYITLIFYKVIIGKYKQETEMTYKKLSLLNQEKQKNKERD